MTLPGPHWDATWQYGIPSATLWTCEVYRQAMRFASRRGRRSGQRPAESEETTATDAMDPEDIIAEVQHQCNTRIQGKLRRSKSGDLSDSDEASQDEDTGFTRYCGMSDTPGLEDGSTQRTTSREEQEIQTPSSGEEQRAKIPEVAQEKQFKAAPAGARRPQAAPTDGQSPEAASIKDCDAVGSMSQETWDQFREAQQQVMDQTVQELRSRISKESRELSQRFQNEAKQLKREWNASTTLAQQRELQRKVWRDAATQWRQQMKKTSKIQEENLQCQYQEELRNLADPSIENKNELRSIFAEVRQTLGSRFRLEGQYLEQSVRETETQLLGVQPDAVERRECVADAAKLIVTVLAAAGLGAAVGSLVIGTTAAVAVGGVVGCQVAAVLGFLDMRKARQARAIEKKRARLGRKVEHVALRPGFA
mmetsp:Transcript_127913/g.292207  ORF Transcript_127913/g.292207 Transcript_127913/m.292207 type:complete len:422 (+) Transcript_127913:106-1371(+)